MQAKFWHRRRSLTKSARFAAMPKTHRSTKTAGPSQTNLRTITIREDPSIHVSSLSSLSQGGARVACFFGSLLFFLFFLSSRQGLGSTSNPTSAQCSFSFAVSAVFSLDSMIYLPSQRCTTNLASCFWLVLGVYWRMFSLQKECSTNLAVDCGFFLVWIGGSIFLEEKYDKSHSVSSMAVCTSCSLERSHGRSHSLA